MSGLPERGESSAAWPGLFRDRRLQRILVQESSGRWLSALRRAIEPADRRSVLPVLGIKDVAEQLSGGVAQGLVLFEPDPATIVSKLPGWMTLRDLQTDWLPVAVGDQRIRGWRQVLLESGFAGVFASLSELDRLLRLASRFFSGQIQDPLDWRERLQLSLPWPGFASAGLFTANTAGSQPAGDRPDPEVTLPSSSPPPPDSPPPPPPVFDAP